MWNMSGRTCAQ